MAPKLLRRVKVKGATGVAFDAAARAWVSAPRRVYVVRQGARKPEKHPLRLGAGVGGAIAASPDGLTLAVGAAHGGDAAALVDVAGHHVHRFRSGRGPGAPGWSPDGVRVYYADGGGATLSLVSPFAHRRLGSVALPGTTPLGVVVQPGLARVQGTDAPDAITGTRLRDLIAGLGGDDTLSGGPRERHPAGRSGQRHPARRLLRRRPLRRRRRRHAQRRLGQRPRLRRRRQRPRRRRHR